MLFIVHKTTQYSLVYNTGTVKDINILNWYSVGQIFVTQSLHINFPIKKHLLTISYAKK